MARDGGKSDEEIREIEEGPDKFSETEIEGSWLAKDQQLKQEALNVLVKGDRYRWVHQTNWFGEPILNLPQDMFALQEIIYKTRPKFIIEVGVAWGGALLFYSTLMEVLGGERIIGIDVYMPGDLKERIMSHGKLSDRLSLIEASSIEQDTIDQIKSIIGIDYTKN